MGRAPCCDKANVKKGPWSPEEDAKLKEYIEKYGTGGNWIALPQKAGLKRCGKSCRLRWLNYLRPNIKHGDFSDEEDRIICNLFANIGSRWSIIAAQLPGRTDNDIKNYWNTKLKKKLMAMAPTLQRKTPSLPPAQNLALHPLLSLYKDLQTTDFSSYSQSLLTLDPMYQLSPSHLGGGMNNADNPSILVPNQESLFGSMNYHNPVHGKDNHILVFGSDASCSSNSDGSCCQISYGRGEPKQEEMLLQGYGPNGYNESSQQKFFLSYGGSNIYSGDRGHTQQWIDQTGCGFGGALLDYNGQESKQVLSSTNSDQFSGFLVEGSKIQDRAIYCDYSLREFQEKEYWMRS